MKSPRKESKLIYFIMITLYLLSRLYFFKSGVRFDASSLSYFWQYLDINVLRNNLLIGTYYQHSQPPLFNFFLGIIVKLFDNSNLAFSIIYHILGMLLYYLIYKTLLIYDFNRWLALFFSTIFICFPEAILYENWLFYTWPIAILLTFSSLMLLFYEKTASLKYAFLFLSTISIICLTRSLFHLIFLLICFSFILLIHPQNNKSIKKGCFISFLIVSSLFLKNFIVFGFFGSSSWIGMNLWRITEIPPSPGWTVDYDVILKKPFSSISHYPERYQAVPDIFLENPALVNEYKENGNINLNHFGYVNLSKEYLKASFYSISHYPKHYFIKLFQSFIIYTRPSWDYVFLNKNRSKIQPYIDKLNFIRGISSLNKKPNFTQKIFIIINSSIIPISLLFIILVLLVRIIKRRPNSKHLNFMVFVILYVAIIANAVEYGENNRFRVETDPLLYLVILILLHEIFIGFRKNKLINANTVDISKNKS